jgi:hypothetical protein
MEGIITYSCILCRGYTAFGLLQNQQQLLATRAIHELKAKVAELLSSTCQKILCAQLQAAQDWLQAPQPAAPRLLQGAQRLPPAGAPAATVAFIGCFETKLKL